MGILKSINQAISMMTSKPGGLKTGKGANISAHRVETMDGSEKPLSAYHGKVLMIVNVASKCGLTPQYGRLVTLHDEYKDRGFAVIGLPANNFMNQEPGSNEDIRNFCSTKYGVNFDVFAKISVSGEDQDPLYKTLTSTKENGELGGPIEWNFAKFIVDKHGNVVGRVSAKTEPDEPAVVQFIEELLARD